jgi:hypothetical protein
MVVVLKGKVFLCVAAKRQSVDHQLKLNLFTTLSAMALYQALCSALPSSPGHNWRTD